MTDNNRQISKISTRRNPASIFNIEISICKYVDTVIYIFDFDHWLCPPPPSPVPVSHCLVLLRHVRPNTKSYRFERHPRLGSGSYKQRRV